jgi:hypothetical protein
VLESRRVLQQRSVDRGGVMELKKPWASSGYSVLTLCVRLCRLRPASPRWTFWSLLGDEGGWL